MAEWREYKLSEVAELTTGFPFDGHKYAKEGIRVVRGDNVTIGSLRWDTDKDKRWNEPFSRADEFSLRDGDIVIGMDGSRVGKNRAQVAKSDLPLLIAQRVACIRHNDKSCQEFLYYLIFSDRFVEYINAIHTGTSIPHVSLKQIGDFPVKLPPVDEQIRISKVLRSLDNKISINNRINHNLEEQAQALFKSWFVDFEPFQDGSFVDSEFGAIPKGWDVIPLGDILNYHKRTINPQKYPDTVFTHYSLPAFDNSKEPEVQKGSEIMSNKIIVENKMILFSKLNPRIKRLWFIDNIPSDSICSTEFIAYKAKEDFMAPFCWCYLNGKGFYDSVLSVVNGATGSHQRFHAEETLKYLIPFNREVVLTFSKLVAPILQTILNNESENKALKKTRDTLLPKLFSGEIAV